MDIKLNITPSMKIHIHHTINNYCTQKPGYSTNKTKIYRFFRITTLDTHRKTQHAY